MDTQHGQTTSQKKAPYFGYLPDGKGGIYYDYGVVERKAQLKNWDGMTEEEAQAQALKEHWEER